MKKILLEILLITISTSALAEWKLITLSAEGNNEIYIETNSIKKNGNKVTVWELMNYGTQKIDTEIANKPYLSTKQKVLYDCKKETNKYLAIIDYSGSMGAGEVVYTSNFESPDYVIAPETIGQTKLKAVCKK